MGILHSASESINLFAHIVLKKLLWEKSSYLQSEAEFMHELEKVRYII